jgi:hypothetical protein
MNTFLRERRHRVMIPPRFFCRYSFRKAVRRGLLALAAWSLLTGAATALTDEGARLFEQSRKSVFQIRVVDQATGEKSTAGSGFFISTDGYVVTNYHVISDYVMKPGQYQIKSLDENGSFANLKLISFDVVHDLAVLWDEKGAGASLKLGHSQLAKGERIFSMGNPYDLGMSIIEGTFNGLMEKSMYRKILFSGSLNPGMSGGPALNRQGEVIGVNVSTMGNDVSFLVPVEFLKDLYQEAGGQAGAPQGNLEAVIEQQVLAQQDQFIESLLGSSWDHVGMGDILIPGEIAVPIKCWSKTEDKDKELMVKVRTACSSEDAIYINEEVTTADYSYWFLQHTNRGMNTFRFYNHIVEDYGSAFPFQNHEDEFFTKFQCRDDFVDIAGRRWKAALCVRQYKRFRRLFDLNLVLSTVDKFDRGLTGAFTVKGVGKDAGQRLIRKFMEEIRWQK